MAQHEEKLVRMANQIADFFAPYPHAHQVEEVRTHLRRFWSPVMKRDLTTYIGKGGAGLRRVVIEAATESEVR